MKSIIFCLLLLFAFPVLAEDVIHATTEDINEFDDLLANEPLDEIKKPNASSGEKKPKGKDGKNSKGDQKAKPPRDKFNEGKGPKNDMNDKSGKRNRKGPPKDDRERGRRKPPPGAPGGGPGGGAPPPPPPG